MSSYEENKAACARGECPYSMGVTDDEIDAMRWLLETLHTICSNGRPNAAKAALARGMLHKSGEHIRTLIHRVHELEDVLHTAGLEEIEIPVERLTAGELN